MQSPDSQRARAVSLIRAMAGGVAHLSEETRVVPGRACGTCSLCCKVVGVQELNKPIGTWCSHAKRQNGRAVYDARPASCRIFRCQWPLAEGIGPESKPDRAEFALLKSDNGRHLTVFVDPGTPGAWRRSPYYEALKNRAKLGLPVSGAVRLVDVMIGELCIVILPDRDVDMGLLKPDEMIQLRRVPAATGETIEVAEMRRPARNETRV